jgi:Cu(I)/Ag(I) efflux system protein CusF
VVKRLVVTFFAICYVFVLPAQAAHHEGGHDGHEVHHDNHEMHHDKDHQLDGDLPSVHGVVRSVNVSAGSITLKHGDIPNLEMGAMTMGFSVENLVILEGLEKGNHVMFQAVEKDGKFVIVNLKKMNH